MTTSNNDEPTREALHPLRAGDLVHFLGTTSFPANDRIWTPPIVVSYGDEIVLTDDLLAVNGYYTDPASWLHMVDDEDAQLGLWGHVLVRPGRWPEGVLRTEPGSREHEEARERLLAKVYRDATDDFERDAGIRLVKTVFGAGPSTSRTLQQYEARR